FVWNNGRHRRRGNDPSATGRALRSRATWLGQSRSFAVDHAAAISAAPAGGTRRALLRPDRSAVALRHGLSAGGGRSIDCKHAPTITKVAGVETLAAARKTHPAHSRRLWRTQFQPDRSDRTGQGPRGRPAAH